MKEILFEILSCLLLVFGIVLVLGMIYATSILIVRDLKDEILGEEE